MLADEPVSWAEKAAEIAEQSRNNPFFMSPEDLEKRLGAFRRLDAAQSPFDPVPGVKPVRMATLSVMNFSGRGPEFWEQMRRWEQERYAVTLFCVNTGEQRRLLELLEEQGPAGRYEIRLARAGGAAGRVSLP